MSHSPVESRLTRTLHATRTYGAAASETRGRVKAALIRDTKRLMFGGEAAALPEGETVERACKGGISL